MQIVCSETIGEQAFMDAVWNAVLQLFGEYGASQTNLILMRHNLKPNYAVLRCSHKALDMVKASLASITQANGKPVAIRVLGVSGTLKGLRRQLPEAQF
jgi:ribonuclease P/MRP protein subunit POP5